MGVVNITPDSFSDGGRYLDPEAAVAHGLQLIAEGADLLDLGAESTRPGGGVYGNGAAAVSAEEELARLLPVLTALRRETTMPLSVDTRKGSVARAALEAGADLVNDVDGLGDPELSSAVAAAGCPVIIMHSRGELSSMQRGIHFEDVTSEVAAELRAAVARAEEAGIDPQRIILDPGIGFGKTVAQNLTLLHDVPTLAGLGHPLLIGASRKSFIGALSDAPPGERLAGSLAAAAWAARGGAALLRVHDVAATVQFIRVWNAIDWGRPERSR